jgi:hypothetical protein
VRQRTTACSAHGIWTNSGSWVANGGLSASLFRHALRPAVSLRRTSVILVGSRRLFSSLPSWEAGRAIRAEAVSKGVLSVSAQHVRAARAPLGRFDPDRQPRSSRVAAGSCAPSDLSSLAHSRCCASRSSDDRGPAYFARAVCGAVRFGDASSLAGVPFRAFSNQPDAPSSSTALRHAASAPPRRPNFTPLKVSDVFESSRV